MSTFKHAREQEDTRDKDQLDQGPPLVRAPRSNTSAAAAAQRVRAGRVQLKTAAGAGLDAPGVSDIAARGMAGPTTEFPHKAAISRSFGQAIPGQAHLDSNAAGACETLGAQGYASGGAAAFASGTPSLHTAAHEAAHLVQQTSGVRLKGNGSASDELEDHADAAADLVERGESAQHLFEDKDDNDERVETDANTPTVSATPDTIQLKKISGAAKAATFTPEISVVPDKTAIDVGERVTVATNVTNAKSAPRGTKFQFGGGGNNKHLSFSSIKEGKTSATMELEGRSVGVGRMNSTVSAKSGKGKTTFGSKFLDITVSAETARASEHLKKLEATRDKGGKVSDRDQVVAEKKAVAAGQGALSRAKNVKGGEVGATINSVLAQIGVLESARARGYLQALGELNAKGLDTEADYSAFAISMGGNLLWALSGLFPAPALGVLATKGLATFFASAWKAATPANTAVVGAIGAMTAQFSGGVPGSKTTSALKSAMVAQLTLINSQACNAMRRQAHIVASDAMSSAPPETTDDGQTYVADLELGLRHALYGDVFTKGLNNGDLVSAGKVQTDARNNLLRQYVVANAALDGSSVEATKSMSGRAEVKDAVSLLGGASALNLDPYELVVNQLRTAAIDMGADIDADSELVAKHLAGGSNVYITINNFNKWAVWGSGSPSKWMRFHTDKIAECDPWIGNEPYMTDSNITGMSRVRVRSQDLSSATIGGKTVFSAKKLYFVAHGAKSPKGSFISVDPPGTFEIKYNVKP